MTDRGATIEFHAWDLLSKFGFEDGDLLWDLISEHGLGVDHHDLLTAVVTGLLLPRLDQEVEVYTIWATLHNPVRARTVDGEPADPSMDLTPEWVEIPVADILGIARTLSREESG
jgi:hypothetical protein